MPDRCLKNIMPVLVMPRFPENIGSVARVCANMGLGPIRLVAPERTWEEPMQRLATQAGLPWLESMSIYETLAKAIEDCLVAIGTSARIGKERGQLSTPRQAGPQILQAAQTGLVALVFGPEDTGLTTYDLDLCAITVNIPTTELSSLNLGQAVMVLAYELRLQALQGFSSLPTTRSKPATMQEKLDMRAHLQQAFAAIKVINPENPEHFMRPYKISLDRAQLSSREVRAWRGLARKILWLVRRLQSKEND